QRELGGASMNFKDSVPYFISRISNQFENVAPPPEKSKNEDKTHEEISVEEAEKVSPNEIPEERIPIEEKEAEKKTRSNVFWNLETDELTSRKSSGEIPEILRQLEKKMTETDGKPTDLLLATNMLSVGVDIQRLGVMIINGQPKKHSEYIQ